MLSEYKIGSSYKIPFSDVNSDISSAIISLIKHYHVLTVEEVGGVYYYNIRQLECFNKYSVLSNTWAGYLKSYFKECHCRYFKEVSLNNYYSDSLIQESVDYVLGKASKVGTLNGYYLGVRVRGNTLFFVEAVLR